MKRFEIIIRDERGDLHENAVVGSQGITDAIDHLQEGWIIEVSRLSDWQDEA